jgi:alginate O-acetyltransferase complex protein AlgI
MVLSTFKYFLFLPVIYLVFYFVGQRTRWMVLLAASILFYAALNVPYLLVVLILVTLITYGFGIWLGQVSTPKAKLSLLWGGIAANVFILVVMKYLPFLSENLKSLLSLFSFNVHLQPIAALVAIGVSFYVFQAISYLIDIYLEIVKPERHLGYFALYLSFFPKLLQGPIERSGDLIPQLKVKYEFNYDNMRFGMLQFAWGLFKKVVIADSLGLYVDAVYNNVHAFTGLPLLLATYAYAFQIYMDFSGYTDMALGSARLFNINLTQNFNSPYIATSVADFWRRWHISFSRWILDYIFKPLQMQWRNWKYWGTAAALMVTFLVSGIWHGASWGFVIWGLLHGVYLACSVFYRPYQKKLHKALGIEKTKFLKAWQIFVTFNLVCLAWVFFRALSVRQALYIISNIFNGWKGVGSEFLFSHGKPRLLIVVTSLILFVVVSANTSRLKEKYLNYTLFRWAIYYSLVFYIIVFAVRIKASFIYLGF